MNANMHSTSALFTSRLDTVLEQCGAEATLSGAGTSGAVTQRSARVSS